MSSGALAAAGSGSGAGAGASLAMVSLLVAVLLLMGFRRSNRYDSCRKCKCVKVKVHPPSLDRSTEVVEGWDIGGGKAGTVLRDFQGRTLWW